MNNTDDTEYEDDEFDAEGYQEDETPEPEIVAEVQPEASPRQQAAINRNYFPFPPSVEPAITPPQMPPLAGLQHDGVIRASAIYMPAHYRTIPDRTATTDLAEASTRLTMHAQASSTPTLVPSYTSRVTPAQRHRNVADALPIIESSASPSPIGTPGRVSAAASDNGAGFFRSYNDRSTNTVPLLGGDGTLTPDLDFAEIGHGRGAQSAGTSTARGYIINRAPRQPPVARPAHDRVQRRHSFVEYTSNPMSVDSTNRGFQGTRPEQAASSSVNQELHDSVQMALDGEPRGLPEQGSSQRYDPRARTVRRQIKDTIYAAGSLFHRGPANDRGDDGPSRPGGSGTNRGSRPR